MRNHHRTDRWATRLASLAVGTTALLTAICSQAQADDRPGVPDPSQAQQVLASAQVHSTVSRFLGTVAAAGNAVPAMPAAGAAAGDQQPFTMDAPVALYELSPDFVKGAKPATAGNAVRLSFLAAPVTGKDGHRADVLLSHDANSWQLAGIRDGDEDAGYAKRATQGTTVFSEPQIHAWYTLVNNKVQPLNHEAQDGLGGRTSMTLADYQKLVHQRYADKTPGSAYDQKGLAGGYGLVAAAPARPSGPSPTVIGGSAAAVGLAGGAVLLRRRRSHAQR
ncbi:hypothetical protein LN042_32810 [Kitasatospora sp. RB6PN24]|uniref:hypothetical protein n=1 Tax=Kitasatospora humi TaxID=2893891 RepID=UPI001E39003E|nr:hypothetical protein [Kitasatospora humi]MCC9311791.1 hypothetical protein [Kitasatospora humi]